MYNTAFSFYNTSGDGTLDVSQLVTVMRALGESPINSEIESICETYRRSCNGLIDLCEFINLMEKWRIQKEEHYSRGEDEK